MLPLDVCSPSFEGTKELSYGDLLQKQIEENLKLIDLKLIDLFVNNAFLILGGIGGEGAIGDSSFEGSLQGDRGLTEILGFLGTLKEGLREDDFEDGIKNFFDRDISLLNIVVKEMVTNFDVFSMRVLHVIFAQVDGSFVVAHYRNVIEADVIVDESLFPP
ncbi:hypothetical protein Tco_0528478 [Tanacetum coccineum]